MKLVSIILAGILTISSHSQMSSAQGQGGWGGNGGNTGSWAGASSHPGQPFSNDPQNNGQFSYGYGGVDSNGVPYGGSGGNGGFHVNVNDAQGRQYTYSGGQGGFGGVPGAPGAQPGQPGQPGYPGPHSYANAGTNRNYDNRYPYSNSSSSSWSSAWSTFYVICLFSLFLIIKS